MRCGVGKTLRFELSVFRLMTNRNVHGRETSKVLGLLRIQCGVILALGIVLSPFRLAVLIRCTGYWKAPLMESNQL